MLWVSRLEFFSSRGRRHWLSSCCFMLWACLAVAAAESQEVPELGETEGIDCGTFDIACQLRSFVEWLICFVFDSFRPFLELLLGFFPEESLELGMTVGAYGALIDEWFPLGLASQYLGAYMIFVFLFIVIKLFVKILIPTVG